MWNIKLYKSWRYRSKQLDVICTMRWIINSLVKYNKRNIAEIHAQVDY